MNNNQDSSADGLADNYEPIFKLRMIRVVNSRGERICENSRRFFKCDAVLRQIRRRFLLIPFKTERHSPSFIRHKRLSQGEKSLRELFAPEEILRYNSVVDAARTPDDLQTLVTGVR